jgi:hypothetical protein
VLQHTEQLIQFSLIWAAGHIRGLSTHQKIESVFAKRGEGGEFVEESPALEGKFAIPDGTESVQNVPNNARKAEEFADSEPVA